MLASITIFTLFQIADGWQNENVVMFVCVT